MCPCISSIPPSTTAPLSEIHPPSSALVPSIATPMPYAEQFTPTVGPSKLPSTRSRTSCLSDLACLLQATVRGPLQLNPRGDNRAPSALTEAIGLLDFGQ